MRQRRPRWARVTAGCMGCGIRRGHVQRARGRSGRFASRRACASSRRSVTISHATRLADGRVSPAAGPAREQRPAHAARTHWVRQGGAQRRREALPTDVAVLQDERYAGHLTDGALNLGTRGQEPGPSYRSAYRSGRSPGSGRSLTFPLCAPPSRRARAAVGEACAYGAPATRRLSVRVSRARCEHSTTASHVSTRAGRVARRTTRATTARTSSKH
jgi:hypothetical protein